MSRTVAILALDPLDTRFGSRCGVTPFCAASAKLEVTKTSPTARARRLLACAHHARMLSERDGVEISKPVTA